jgi:uncharacterized protein YndB with AHSA1/START domain
MTTSEAITSVVQTHRHVPAQAEGVWRALVEPAQVGNWLAAAANICPERGGDYELFWQPDTPEHNSTIGCRITAIAACRYLAFTWRGPDELSAIMNDGDPPPPPTHVTITLIPTPTGTDVEVRHAGFGHGDGWAEAVTWHERSWATCLDNLEALLSDQPRPHPWH